jgi:cyclic pyranopterin phosphate synthase
MVDVSAKPATLRTARAHAFVRIRPGVLKKLPANPKGNPLEIARIAGITAAKRASELIPLCHPLALTHADVEVAVEKRGVRIVSSAATTGPTGVEMEALAAAAVAALTVYDMVKGLDKSIEIQDLYLLEKTGGRSGNFRRKEAGWATAAPLADARGSGRRKGREGVVFSTVAPLADARGSGRRKGREGVVSPAVAPLANARGSERVSDKRAARRGGKHG